MLLLVQPEQPFLFLFLVTYSLMNDGLKTILTQCWEIKNFQEEN